MAMAYYCDIYLESKFSEKTRLTKRRAEQNRFYTSL